MPRQRTKSHTGGQQPSRKHTPRKWETYAGGKPSRTHTPLQRKEKDRCEGHRPPRHFTAKTISSTPGDDPLRKKKLMREAHAATPRHGNKKKFPHARLRPAPAYATGPHMDQKAPRRRRTRHVGAVILGSKRHVKTSVHVHEVYVVRPRFNPNPRHLMNHSELPPIARGAQKDVRPLHLGRQQLRATLTSRQQRVTWWHIKGTSGASFRAVRSKLVMIANNAVDSILSPGCLWVRPQNRHTVERLGHLSIMRESIGAHSAVTLMFLFLFERVCDRMLRTQS